MKKLVYLLILTSILLVGCNQKINEPEAEMNEGDRDELQEQEVHGEMKQLEVELINTDGVGVGVATLKEKSEGVQIELDAHHLEPGLHGFHIHERGLCEAPTFESAGGHFNPTNKQHGFDNPDGPHAGDMLNIEVKEDGTVTANLVNEMVTLKEGVAHSLIGKEGSSLMIHADPDDYVSQPAGNAGDRIVCGVISAPESDSKK